MDNELEQTGAVEGEPLDISGAELADLLDSGLDPTEIDRLRFTRWRLRTDQLQGDNRPHYGGRRPRTRSRARSAGQRGTA